LATLLLSGALWSPLQAAPAKPACEDAGSTPEIQACIDRLLKAADAELNRVYQAAMRSIDKADHLNAEQRKGWKAALQKAQRQWIAFRDADCGEPVGYEWFGGTGMGAAVLGCKLTKTEARIAELRQRYEQR
jgi:uncharacterized protein YecT (DUF1311 family)